MRALPDFTDKEIDNWLVKEKITEASRPTYRCICKKCGYKKNITSTDLNKHRNLSCGGCSEKWSSSKKDSLTGTRKGSLTIGECFRKNERTYYHVKCDCGKEYDILRSNLKKGYTNCKCHGLAIKPGTKYGMLMPIERMPDGLWKCECDCGNICYKSPGWLNRDKTNISCGCKKKADKIAKRSDNKSGIKGVCFVSSKQMYLAYITKDGVTYRCGFHKTKEEEAKARREKEAELFG